MNEKKLIGGVLALWLLAFSITGPVGNYYDRHFQPNYSNRSFIDVALDILGDARTLLARYLWFKMDIMHEMLDDKGQPAFRQKDVIPLMRMVTYLDPTFDQAYDTIAFDLWKGYGQTQRAMDLIMEGLKGIPTSYLLHFRAAFLAYEQRDWPVVEVQSRLAYQYSKEEFDRLNAVRLLYHAAVATGNWQDGIPAAEIYQQMRPQYTDVGIQLKKWRAEHPNVQLK